MTQTRWQCGECHREWQYAHNWAGTHCPACGSEAVSRVTYAAVFPGADIATPPDAAARALAAEVPRVLPFVAPNVALQASEVDAYVGQLAALLGEAL